MQLDVRRAPERFLLWPGDEGNTLEVEGLDRDLRQLVLLVKEPRHTFEVELARWGKAPPGTQVVRQHGHRRWIRQETRPGKRHFLLGHDEAHLFIAQLPRGVSTVGEAHRVLKGQVDQLEATLGTRAVRQGEWFFLRAPASVQAALDEPHAASWLRRAWNRGLAQTAGWLRPGRQHLATSLSVVVPGAPSSVPQGLYVRGEVRHPDHRTLRLVEWHRVVGNTEARAQVPGLSWVD